MSLRPVLLPLAAAVLLGLAACGKDTGPHPPMVSKACYQVVHLKTGAWRFNLVAPNQPNLENCAAHLEGLRIHFLSLGGNRHDMWGVYQGQYIYINEAGVFSSQEIDGPQYPMLVRSGDGRLVVPGAMPQGSAPSE